eukprot:6026762-Prymnesium_polylepis.1
MPGDVIMYARRQSCCTQQFWQPTEASCRRSGTDTLPPSENAAAATTRGRRLMGKPLQKSWVATGRSD